MNQRFLIFTDLDGSLLDHYTYSFEPALPMLRKLQEQDHLIIPTSSKTAAEIRPLQLALQNESAFIAENGAAAYLPERIFRGYNNTEAEQGYYSHALGKPRSHWQVIINECAKEFRDCYTSFSELSIEQLMEITGLDQQTAQLAAQRQYGEPIHWHGSESQKAAFIQDLTDKGASVLEGGRFLHIAGNINKGKAMQWLEVAYSARYPDLCFHTLAIGDGKNDVDMLEAADYALVIKSPAHPPPELERTDNVFYSTAEGPAGWAEGVSKIMDLVNNPKSKRAQAC